MFVFYVSLLVSEALVKHNNSAFWGTSLNIYANVIKDLESLVVSINNYPETVSIFAL